MENPAMVSMTVETTVTRCAAKAVVTMVSTVNQASVFPVTLSKMESGTVWEEKMNSKIQCQRSEECVRLQKASCSVAFPTDRMITINAGNVQQDGKRLYRLRYSGRWPFRREIRSTVEGHIWAAAGF